MRLAVAAIAACALLAGCATTKIPERVEVPIPVPCKVEEPAVPDYRYAPPYDNVFDAVRDLLGDRQLAQAYENELRIALKSCR